MLSLLLSTLLSLAIPAVFVGLWLTASEVVAARIRDLEHPPERRTRRLTDTKPRRLL